MKQLEFQRQLEKYMELVEKERSIFFYPREDPPKNISLRHDPNKSHVFAWIDLDKDKLFLTLKVLINNKVLEPFEKDLSEANLTFTPYNINKNTECTRVQINDTKNNIAMYYEILKAVRDCPPDGLINSIAKVGGSPPRKVNGVNVNTKNETPYNNLTPVQINLIRSELISRLKKVIIDPIKKQRLQKLKDDGIEGLERQDFIWHYMLRSFATWGNSAGFEGLINNEINYNKVTFYVIDNLPIAQRESEIERVFLAANVRYAASKAQYLNSNLNLIKQKGGLLEVKKQLLDLVGSELKIKFLRKFKGIGEKYARNIMMDVYHVEFRNSIAIDSRIESISKSWGLVFSNYNEHEQFWLSIASEAGLEGWEVDRLLYTYKNEFLNDSN